MDFILTLVFVVICGTLIYVTYRRSRKSLSEKLKSFPRKYPTDVEKFQGRNHFDVAIVGAGPAGATCAYYLAKAGRNVVVLEKKKFPRDKYCGDAVCKTAIEILDDMGIYDKLLSENKAKVADHGGLVSPSGFSYIGRSKEHLGRIPAAIACKRIHLDNEIAMTARKAGAILEEECPVQDAKLDKETGLWTITIEGKHQTFTARLLVCADGATSQLASKLGIVRTPPESISSRAYVEKGTHQFKADGVVFYPRDLLPGYAALFKHPFDELNYCVYIIPGNPKATTDDLPAWHERLMKSDPYISKALGPSFKIERMRAASLRLGGVPLSYGDHVIVVGDAAGMVDPMTGEGIHHAMEGGKMAAEFLCECLKIGNYDKEVLENWQDIWMTKFGNDFKWSMQICQLLYRFPILLDAATAAVCRKGDKFLARWADIMTGRVPKVHLLRPEFVITITYELIVLTIKKALGQKIQRNKED